MILFIPVLILLSGSLTLVLLWLFRPNFRFNLLIGASTALLAVVTIILWKFKLPFTFSVPTWQPASIFLYTPSWLVDAYSWPYALSLATLTLSFILTSVIRKLTNSINWAGILFLSAIGLLAVTANNPLTLVIFWVALDLSETIFLLNLVKPEKSNDIVVSLSIRMASIFLLLWSSILSISSGTPLDFRSIPGNASVFILLATGLRLGSLLIHHPIDEIDIKRGIITVLKLITAASGLILLARLPIKSISIQTLQFLILFTGIISIIASWIWFVSKDEVSGRPYWIISLSGLAFSSIVFGNFPGSLGWGSSMILCGGLIFQYSGRDKRNYWLPALCLWSLSTLPFSLTASAWTIQSTVGSMFLIPTIFAHALLLSGFFRHAFFHSSEVNISSEPRWIQIFYTTGLSILPIIIILISFWAWSEVQSTSNWWISVLSIGSSIILIFIHSRLRNTSKGTQVKLHAVKPNRFPDVIRAIYHFLRQLISLISSTLEGDGGILWSILILVLLISLISQISH